jgi:hypothetical protein
MRQSNHLIISSEKDVLSDQKSSMNADGTKLETLTNQKDSKCKTYEPTANQMNTLLAIFFGKNLYQFTAASISSSIAQSGERTENDS